MQAPSAAFIGPIGSDFGRTLDEALSFTKVLDGIRPGDRVVLKPNLTAPRFMPGVTTRPETIEAMVRRIREITPHIIIGESNGGYNSFQLARAWKTMGLDVIAQRYGATLVNFSEVPRKSIKIDWRGESIEIPLPALLLDETDFFVTLPVPKVHCLTGVSLGFKNQWGCIPDVMRLVHHPIFHEAIIHINRRLAPRCVVLDGTFGLDRNGPLDGDVVEPGWLLVATDVGASDRIGCKLMGVDPRSCRYLRVAEREGALPAIESIRLNRKPDEVATVRFKLRRNFWNYVALSAWQSRKWNELVYISPLADPLHKLMYMVRPRPKALE
jgi:uncharacterized protein (DUF362 family)